MEVKFSLDVFIESFRPLQSSSTLPPARESKSLGKHLAIYIARKLPNIVCAIGTALGCLIMRHNPTLSDEMYKSSDPV